MTKRLMSGLFCALYIAVACCFGLLHDHHDGAAHEHCAACAWAVNAVTDVPVVITPVVHSVVAATVVLSDSAVLISSVFCTTASRAPPVASA